VPSTPRKTDWARRERENFAYGAERKFPLEKTCAKGLGRIHVGNASASGRGPSTSISLRLSASV
jgi:hypothetical protein